MLLSKICEYVHNINGSKIFIIDKEIESGDKWFLINFCKLEKEIHSQTKENYNNSCHHKILSNYILQLKPIPEDFIDSTLEIIGKYFNLEDKRLRSIAVIVAHKEYYRGYGIRIWQKYVDRGV